MEISIQETVKKTAAKGELCEKATRFSGRDFVFYNFQEVENIERELTRLLERLPILEQWLMFLPATPIHVVNPYLSAEGFPVSFEQGETKWEFDVATVNMALEPWGENRATRTILGQQFGNVILIDFYKLSCSPQASVTLLTATILHELTHYVEETVVKGYDSYKAEIYDCLAENEKKKFYSMVKMCNIPNASEYAQEHSPYQANSEEVMPVFVEVLVYECMTGDTCGMVEGLTESLTQIIALVKNNKGKSKREKWTFCEKAGGQ